MSGFVIQSELGNITMKWRDDAAPKTVAYIKRLIETGEYSNTTFYRSDFVIQCGRYPNKNSFSDLTVNETNSGTVVSNTRGTAAIAHFDVPDCGNSEFFINLQTSAHLDQAYGGYCVFAEVAGDFTAVDAIAKAIGSKQKSTVKITGMNLC
jgi:cyclophilin family peptidyl-prolyl cis-trans isomerase